MGRPVVLSNGKLFVGIDENGLVHDFYYPYVGLDNLTNARNSQHKIGVWVDDKFSWTDDGSWSISVDFEPTAMFGVIRMESASLSLELNFHDFVDEQHNAFIRRVSVHNKSDARREVRLFMHQVFQISRAGRADTAFYVPDDNYIFDYKGRCCLLIAGKKSNGESFDQFAVGNYAIEGKAGTFKDAEDGELSGNLIEHGGVDSVIRFSEFLDGNSSFGVDYWIAAANSQSDAAQIHQILLQQSIGDHVDNLRKHYEEWFKPSQQKLMQLPEDTRVAVQKSLLIIKAHCDDRGSILASGDSSIFNYGRDYYCYCWPRDAAYAVWPLIRLGIYDEAKKFFAFSRDTLHKDGYLMHKYQPDRAIGSTWHPLLHGHNRELAIQEDETAIVLFMIGEFYKRSRDRDFIQEYFESFIVPCAHFLSEFIDKQTGLPHASYDLWEQKFLTSTYSVSTVIAGLEASAAIAKELDHHDYADQWQNAARKIREVIGALYHPDGYFRKGFILQSNGDLSFDDTLDISSLYGPYMFAELPLEDKRLVNTAEHVRQRLLNSSPLGGVIRYEGDGYFLSKQQYKGNPWIVCTMWLAQYYIGLNKMEEAFEFIGWALERRLPSGALSEQFDPETGEQLGVTPLVWSHAELINTVLDYYQNKSSQQLPATHTDQA